MMTVFPMYLLVYGLLKKKVRNFRISYIEYPLFWYRALSILLLKSTLKTVEVRKIDSGLANDETHKAVLLSGSTSFNFVNTYYTYAVESRGWDIGS